MSSTNNVAGSDHLTADGSDGSDGNGDIANEGRWSDRVLGAIGLLGAAWYTITARTFDGTGFGSGPVGPKTLPTAIGILFGLLSLYLIIRPDQSPTWPTRRAGWQIALVVGASYVYGQIIQPVGFILSSALMTIIIGILFRAPLTKLIPMSVLFPTVLAFVFNNWLSLRLPAGVWGGF